MKENLYTSYLMPCKLAVPIPTKMEFPGHKTSLLRRSHSLSQRPRFAAPDGGRGEVTSDIQRARRLSIDEETTHFCVLQPKPGFSRCPDGKLQYPRPNVTLKRESSPNLHDDESSKFTRHKAGTASTQLSPKSILKNFTAASYRNPVLVSRADCDEKVAKQPSCLRSRDNDAKGRQPSPRSSFRYRLSLGAPSSANDKRVTFDEEVSYINDNNMYRRRHSTPSLPLL